MILTPELEEVGRRTRLLRDRVLVKPLPYVHPTLATPGVEVQKGVVIAVGYGRRECKKSEMRNRAPDPTPIVMPDGRLAKFATTASSDRVWHFDDPQRETGRIIPMQVKPGDVIEFSFRNVQIVGFDRLGFDGIGDLLVIWQAAVYFVDPDESLNECLLWQQSAGYDRNGNYMSGAESWHKA